ncbi:hypothetical protein [Ornithinimicrobium kibberense]|uniref:hypothetical protein n=1 Tax=Ornithinimicrobium kibberense TaxID=282060 RepID=UPI00360C27AD
MRKRSPTHPSGSGWSPSTTSCGRAIRPSATTAGGGTEPPSGCSTVTTPSIIL